MPIAATDRGDDVESGFVDIAGLDAVDTVDTAEQVIVVTHHFAAKREGPGRKIAVVFGKAILDRAAEKGHVARRGDLLVVGQSRGVAVDGVHHAELTGLGGHQLGKFCFVAGERFGNDRRHVVCRLGDDGADRGFHLDRLAGLEPELRWCLHGSVRRHIHFGRELDLSCLKAFEQQVKRHDLGERGRMARAVGVGGLHHRAGIDVHHDGGGGGLIAFGGGRTVVAMVTARAGVGVAGKRGNGHQGNQRCGTPTQTALGLGSCTRHQLSPKRLTTRFPAAKMANWQRLRNAGIYEPRGTRYTNY